MPTIDCYISLNSPWTYMGSKRLIDLANQHSATVNVWPVNLGAVFPETGGLPLPKRSPQRQAYRMMELKRWRDFHGIDIKLEPAHFPADERPGVALVYAAKDAGADALRLSSEIGAAVWEREENIADAAVLDAACGRAGVDASKLRAIADGLDVDTIYGDATRAAIVAGVFGAPTYRLGDELFWGQDRLDFVDRALAR